MSPSPESTARRVGGRTVALLSAVLPLLGAGAAGAGSLDAPAAPDAAGSAMYTLEDVYNRLDANTQATRRSGAFVEPAAGPAPTGHTLNEVYAKAIPTQVPKTGQTAFYETGDDGDLEKGVAWPSPRFTDNSDGTVTDNLTGLIWLQDANCFRSRLWSDALTRANALYDGCTDCGGTDGDCGLGDSSAAGDWRLPNIKELQSLVDFGQYDPALPSGHPFSGVLSSYNWSSTSYADYTSRAWYLNLYSGYVNFGDKSLAYDVWPVRGGQ
ncbi:DUF1566 domain-containing protein [Thiohalocapsa marina]|uniref:DUF1566 domain-containing protein n=1 Tax=Thiohalocapsa marina TaxID=424902 RepID=A0A5M8FSI3_9GAMM|nr:DUF1566 domain-containing protein [Thiohalocapsa marina]KAA6185112.1 DUF1566 domain-containing protein [Thiohalocapsa marina]